MIQYGIQSIFVKIICKFKKNKAKESTSYAQGWVKT